MRVLTSLHRLAWRGCLGIVGLSLVIEPTLADEFEEFKRQQAQQFEQYLSEQDQAYSDYLAQHWEEFAVFTGKLRPAKPKPANAPSAKASLAGVSRPQSKAPGQIAEAAERHFYGHVISSAPYGNLNAPKLHSLNSKAIAKAWENLSTQWQDAQLQALQGTAQELELGDWGKYQLLRHLSATHQGAWDHNQQTLVNWFILTRWGYSARLSYNQTQLFLLLPAAQQIYGKPYISIDDKTYYFVESRASVGSTFSYRQDYTGSPKQLELDFQHALKTRTEAQSVSFHYEKDKTPKQLELHYAPDYVRFFQDYPQIELKHYFSAPPAPQTQAMLSQQIQSRLDGMSEREAASYLLALVQTGFGYLRDEEQFGFEKYLLPDESLAFGFNDCEDRSIFLAWLVKNLLQLEVVGLDYPEHIALAIALKEQQPGDWSIEHQGRRYVIADPTYIHAGIGEVMPDLVQVQPQVFTF